jgi:hypothetical protein
LNKNEIDTAGLNTVEDKAALMEANLAKAKLEALHMCSSPVEVIHRSSDYYSGLQL